MRGIEKLPGTRFFGVPWVIETADAAALDNLAPLYRSLVLSSAGNMHTALSLGGRGAYAGKCNPYPADYDFSQIVIVRAGNLPAAGEIFARVLQGHVQKLIGSGRFTFSELKAGADPDTGKGLKWTLQDVARGFTEHGRSASEKPVGEYLRQAVIRRQMIKLDLLTRMEDLYREVTVLFRFAWVRGR